MSELQSSVAADTGLGLAPVETASFFERWYVLIMMCLVYTLSIADRYVVSTVLEPIRLELNLTDSGVAVLTGGALGVFYVLLGFPLSWLIDRKNRRNIVAICLVVWSVMTTVCGFARTTWQFFGARVGVGIGEAGGTPGANSLLSDYFPATRRPMALTIFSLGAPLGAFVGYQIAGLIADRYGWRTVFYVLGVPGVLTGLAVWLTVREPRRGCLDSGDDGEAPSFMDTMRFLWSQRSAVHVMIASALCALWGWGLVYWTPAFLQRTYAMTPGEAGNVTGYAHLIGGALATVATGWLMGPDRWPTRSASCGSWVPASPWRRSLPGVIFTRMTSRSPRSCSGSLFPQSTSTSDPASDCSTISRSAACERSFARPRCFSPTSATS